MSHIEIPSTVTCTDLLQFWKHYNIADNFDLLPCDGFKSFINSETPPGFFTFFENFLQCRLVPYFSSFVEEVMICYNIAPTQLHPNAWRLILSFESLCLMHDILPMFYIFNYFYALKKRLNSPIYFIEGRKGRVLLTRLSNKVRGWSDRYF